ncbi:hypothetical protein GF361_03765 [Candidatus Woesearchaeota archaeon]|nr:hypothetical protein [Candidatus Woesearchaeota archaeon]
MLKDMVLLTTNCPQLTQNYGRKMEIPNKNYTDYRKEMMPFKKFVQSQNKLFREDKKFIRGVFRDTKTGKIVKGDDFEANIVGDGSAEETYKLYLLWNNIYFGENREFVSAKWDSADN